MKILTIIGGSGFIGKSFIDGFQRNVISNLKIKKINIICRKVNNLKLNKRLKFKNIKIIKGDIRLLKKIPKSDLVVYAAETSKIKDFNNKVKISNDHKNGIDNFCKIIKKNKNTKILYISSGAVYQSKLNHKKSDSYKNIYSNLKIYSENRIKQLSKFNIKTTIARCFTFIGFWLPKNQHYAIGNFIRDGLTKKIINVRTKKTLIRSYMYADDLIYWLTKIALNANLKCPIYNVGSNKPVDINSVASLIGKILNKPVKFSNSKVKKIDKYVPNIYKAKKKLKLKINYDLKESINLSINGSYEKVN